MTALLDVAALDAHYGRAQILHGVSFSVPAGGAVALLGRNGAGKSTVFKSIMGLVRQRRGSIEFRGRQIVGEAAFRIARAGIGYVPEDRRIFSDLTVEENLLVGRRGEGWTVERLYALFPNLGAMRRRRGGMMSGGEQQMLTIARTLMGNPALLMLDEPSEGIAPRIVEDLAASIIALKREGTSLLISEQNLHFARLIAEDAVILERGVVRFAGSFAELNARAELHDAYLAV